MKSTLILTTLLLLSGTSQAAVNLQCDEYAVEFSTTSVKVNDVTYLKFSELSYPINDGSYRDIRFKNDGRMIGLEITTTNSGYRKMIRFFINDNPISCETVK